MNQHTLTESPLRLEGITKQFPGFSLSVSLEVPRGCVMGLVGANGSGKTTTIKTALGLVHPDSGDVHLIDKCRLGVVMDSSVYNPSWTVAQTGRLLAGYYPQWDAERFRSLTEGWSVPADRKVKDLSRGMGMKLQLAAALSHGAELLILDEPSSGLDPVSREELLDILADFMTDEDHTILFSTHITSELERLADYITVMDRGRVIASDAADDLRDSYRMVAGEPSDLTDEIRAVAHGLRRHGTGWDALIPVASMSDLAADLHAEAPALDDIVVRLGKENHHA